ncbi:hypothetical protein PSTG_16552 [Puccinia striiformis f. sp. tritici PST-78]|uniref:Uncharacterized protein n=1 Tax=Puccinia striiformis f. sp. tritici PST-78 TaxID=1165861 RepID=A0A0L0USX4_9BASI|nr:hypothetical protein PSTG_16552 [Puccinia striiformis f. sp. tritici PST-78]
MVIDEKIAELDPVISEMNADSMEDVRSGNVPVEDVEEVPLSLLEEKESDGKEGELSWTDMIGIAVGQIDSEPEDAILDATSPLFCQEEEKIKVPYQFVASGIRSFFTAYHIKLPRWEALREMRAKIQTLLNHTVVEKETVFGQPVFGLSARELIRDDLMNPLVAPHLEFVPEDAHGRDIYKMSQSSKWLKHLEPDLRVQMVESNEKHFYIFEPVQLKTHAIVVPFFFFTHDKKYFAKCYQPIIKSNVDQSKLEIHLISDIPYDDNRLKVVSVDEFSLIYKEIAIKNGLKLSECCGGKMIDLIFPNLWRTKAAGKLLRHIPINLYCDDTSGNKSKKWNKHNSYYFTLSGLPPKISNQQFDCHFLCTSNIAGPLELGEMVVDQLK